MHTDLFKPIDPFKSLGKTAVIYEQAIKARVAMGNIIRPSKTQIDTIFAEAGINLKEVGDEELYLGFMLKGMDSQIKLLIDEMEAGFKIAAPELYEFALSVKYLGAPSMARLIGMVGDPLVAHPHHYEPNPKFDESKPGSVKNKSRFLIADPSHPRSLSQFRAYCGYGDPALRRIKDMPVEDAYKLGSPNVKAHIRTIVKAQVTGGSNGAAYYPFFLSQNGDEKKGIVGRYTGMVDADGKPWTGKHRENAAYRNTAQAILKDIWLVRKGEQPMFGMKSSDLEALVA